MVRRNRNGVRKERIIMLATSAFVLTALTMTGVFVRRNHNAERQDYVLDLEEIEKTPDVTTENMLSGDELDTLFAEVGTDDLDYDPSFQETNSQKVERAEGHADTSAGSGASAAASGSASAAAQTEAQDGAASAAGQAQDAESGAAARQPEEENEEGMFDETVDTASAEDGEEVAEAISTTVQPTLDFHIEDGLVWPIVGDVLINYSMDKTTYFYTLQQYKYNPAIIIGAPQGESIAAAAPGRVTDVDYDPVIGNTVVMDLGNGYELTYGQLDNIIVSEGSYVSVGDNIGTVACPTKYFSVEGANVYFKLTKDGEPVNPLSRLEEAE